MLKTLLGATAPLIDGMGMLFHYKWVAYSLAGCKPVRLVHTGLLHFKAHNIHKTTPQYHRLSNTMTSVFLNFWNTYIGM